MDPCKCHQYILTASLILPWHRLVTECFDLQLGLYSVGVDGLCAQQATNFKRAADVRTTSPLPKDLKKYRPQFCSGERTSERVTEKSGLKR